MKDVEIIKARNVLSSRSRANLAKRLRVAAYCRVSTDSEDQLNSYKSQVQHYTDLIKSKPEWDLAGIYADEAITGTQVTKREDFQRLINDCMNGDVDMIITKSISRFARNTLDTLKYVRMLKEKGIAVFFEEENINTLTMDGELLLVILSSVAQQEVENISANVKKGLKMKMQRGELVGFQGCLGYDYHPEDKSITINEEEAEIVRYIFRRYIEGAGGSVISQELEHLGYKTKRGSTRWAETTVIGIIKNEKYKGDILMGKTFTLDPISKRRLDNFGEEDQFYIRDHHEAIISEEMFEKAQEILKRRAKPRRLGTDGKREKFSRKYAFSCMLECGFCGSTLTRRSWHSGSQYNKVIWQCVTATKKGKKFCPDSKGIAEETIEQAFIESYRLLCQNNKDVLDEFIARTEETLSDGNAGKQLAKVEKDIAALDAKRDKLVDMRLEEIIDKDTYEQKYFDLSSQIEQLQKQREDLQESAETESTMKKRIAEFRKTLEENEVLDTFDRYVFESIVEKVIVGGYDEDGNKDPSMLTFIYKTGFKNSLDGTNFKPPRKNSKTAKQNAGLCSHTTDEAKSMYSYHSNTTCRMCDLLICKRQSIKMPCFKKLYSAGKEINLMINHKGTQQIKTERLLLRKILPEDAEMVYVWMSDPEVCKYERWRPHPSVDYSRGYIIEVFDYYKSDRTYQWGIETNGKLIGSVSVVNINEYDQKAVLGYCLAREFWSNGYATESVKAVLAYMFLEVGLNRVEASHSVNNVASGRVLEKAGLCLEGLAKDYYFCNSGFQDSRLFGITKAQFLASR